MKKSLVVMVFIIKSLPAYADIATDSSTGLGKIISVKPHYNTTIINEQNETCTTSNTTVSSPDTEGTTTGKVIGGVLGGVGGAVAGNQVAQGGAGTVIGAVTGLLIGGFAGNSLSKHEVQRQATANTVTCTTSSVPQSKKIQNGYTVTYLYNGVTQTTFMNKKPVGKYLNVAQLSD